MRHIVTTALGLVFCAYVHSLATGQRSPATADTVPSYNQPSSPTSDQSVSFLIGLEQCGGPGVSSFLEEEVAINPIRTAYSNLLCLGL